MSNLPKKEKELKELKEKKLEEFFNRFVVKNPSSQSGYWWKVPFNKSQEIASPEEVRNFILKIFEDFKKLYET